MGKSASELVGAAKAKVQELSPEQVAAELERGDAVLVDLREGPELEASGRIPGSVHVPRGMLEFRADPTSTYHDQALEPGKRVILHCASGGRSALAAATTGAIRTPAPRTTSWTARPPHAEVTGARSDAPPRPTS